MIYMYMYNSFLWLCLHLKQCPALSMFWPNCPTIYVWIKNISEDLHTETLGEFGIHGPLHVASSKSAMKSKSDKKGHFGYLCFLYIINK